MEKSSITRDFPVAKMVYSILKDSVSSSFCLPGWNKGRIVCQKPQLKKILVDMGKGSENEIMNLSNAPIPVVDSRTNKGKVRKGGMNNGEVKIGLNGGSGAHIDTRTEVATGSF